MVHFAMLLGAAAGAAQPVSITSGDGWFAAFEGHVDTINGTQWDHWHPFRNPMFRTIEGSQFYCRTGAMFEYPDTSGKHRTNWQQHPKHPTTNGSVVYTPLAVNVTNDPRLQHEDNEVQGVLVKSLWEESMKQWVSLICRPAAVVKVLNVFGRCLVIPFQSLDDNDCPIECVKPGTTFSCGVNLTNDTCLMDERCIPAAAHIQHINGTGQMRVAGRPGCLAADEANISVQTCNDTDKHQQWTVQPVNQSAASISV